MAQWGQNIRGPQSQIRQISYFSSSSSSLYIDASYLDILTRIAPFHPFNLLFREGMKMNRAQMTSIDDVLFIFFFS